MALSAVKTFVAGEVLYASDLNAMNTNILSNALTLVSPWTANMAAGGFILTGLGLGTVTIPAIGFTGDTNTGPYSSAADTYDIATGGVRAASLGAPALIAAAPGDGRTNSVDVVHEFRSTTSGTPAAGIGTGILVSAESADENPSNFGRLDFVATDVTAGSEDTVFDILLRTAGAALGSRYRFASTGAFLYTLTGAPTAARTITFPDSDVTLGGSGGLTRVGGNTTEGTTISTSAVDIVTVSSLSIAANTPVMIVAALRKSTGDASAAYIGLKINSTVVEGGETTGNNWSSTANEVQTGIFVCFLLPSASYLRAGYAFFDGQGASAGNAGTMRFRDSDAPNATIASIAIRGSVANAANTMGVDDVHVYTLATS